MADDIQELVERINQGNLGTASKSDLHRYSIALTRPNAYASFSAQQFPQVCESVRLLLSDAIANEANSANRRISIFVVLISLAALIGTCIQAFIAIASRQ